MLKLIKCKRTHPDYQVIRDRHYVANKGCHGQQIHYLIEYGARGIVGIISGASSVYAVKSRDLFFGLNKDNKRIALNSIINNVVFRLEYHEKNLGTQILSMWRKQISIDWEERYKVKVHGFETFVVEEETRKGCMYKADNWIYVGDTAGSTKSHKGLSSKSERHATIPKMIYVKKIPKTNLCTSYTPTWNINKKVIKMAHSKIVGGSTAKRVINCPGSVALCNAAPEKPSSSYAEEGTLLHEAIALFLDKGVMPANLNDDLIEEKFLPAVRLLDEIDPDNEMDMFIEAEVNFGDYIPDVFGSCDLLGRLDSRAVVLDWKFGNGVIVDAVENEQLMFYAAAAMRTKATQWIFKDCKDVELIIIQPPMIKRWVTSVERIKTFEHQLLSAVNAAMKLDAPLREGSHCKWCAAKPTCPLMTGAVDRALQVKLEAIDPIAISSYLQNAEILEEWIKDLRALAFNLLNSGISLPEYKLVAKRATRKWSDEIAAKQALLEAGLTESDVVESSLVSPAQAEKKLKKLKKPLPEDTVVSISSGNTMAHVDDARPAVLLIGQQLSNALNKLQ